MENKAAQDELTLNDSDMVVHEELVEYKDYKEKEYTNSDKEPFGLTIKGKAKEFYKAHEKLRNLVVKNKQYIVADFKVKVLDMVKHKSMDDCTIEISGDGTKGNAELKIYHPNPDKKKGATLELRKKPGFDYDVVKKLKNVINIIVDGYMAGFEIEDIFAKSNKVKKAKISKVTSQCKLFSCDLCNFETKHVAAFKAHKTRIHKQFKCNMCVYKAKTQSELKEHMKIQHENTACIKCKDCDYVAKEQHDLEKHNLMTHGKDEGNPCDFCDYKTTMQSVLEEHKKLIHKLQIFSCTICGYIVYNESVLENHKNEKHKENLKRTKETVSPSSSPPRKKQEMDENVESVELMDFEIEADSLIVKMLETRIKELEAVVKDKDEVIANLK